MAVFPTTLTAKSFALLCLSSSLLIFLIGSYKVVSDSRPISSELLGNDIIDPSEEAFVFHGTGTMRVIAINGADGMYIDKASFEVHSADGSTILHPSSKYGRFELEVQAPMVYTVFVYANGFADYSTEVEVAVDHVTTTRIVTVPKPGDNTYKAYVVLQWARLPEHLDLMVRTPKCLIDPDSPQHCVDNRVKVLHKDFSSHGPTTIGIREFEAGDYVIAVDGLDELAPYKYDAKVILFIEGREPEEFLLGRDGYVHAPVWKVFRIFNGGQDGRFGGIADCPNEACAFGKAPIA